MTRHVPVLLNEVIDSLQLKAGKHVIDCTVGDAGHSEEMLKRTAPYGRLLAIDADTESLLRAKKYLYSFGDRVTFVRDNFANLATIIAEAKFGPADAILMDFGWSSPQFAERGRGFSFDGDEPLDMRYSAGQQSTEVTAAHVVNEYSELELIKIFKNYGEENLAKEIAEAIVTSRKKEPIQTTRQLTEIILQTYRTKLKTDKEVPWIGGIHPATKVFQAIRIEVNHELDVIKKVLPQAIAALAPGGRLAVITFHSLEDRIVKHYFQANSKLINLINKKPITASEGELEANPRARSAKLRVVEKK